MLCSHSKKFIYLKTIKTAGTSVEIFFEKYCCPPDGYIESHATNEVISPYGIIGYRGIDPTGSVYYNHMPAEIIKKLLGKEIWDSYLKFCVIRNPYDKAVSMFWMMLSQEERMHLFKSDFQITRDRFSEFVNDVRNLPSDRHIFTIDGRVEVDFFIKYENLLEDIKSTCQLIGVDFKVENLGNYKRNFRLRSEHYSEYYRENSRRRVADFYAWEISNFNYTI